MTWVVWSLLRVWMPIIILISTSTCTVSIGERYLKYLCKKFHSGIGMQAIWKLSILSYTVFEVLFYTVFCVFEAKVNQVIPCLSIIWKSSGSLLMKHLILILSLSLIVILLGKLILLSLKVTLNSFQSMSRVSQI